MRRAGAAPAALAVALLAFATRGLAADDRACRLLQAASLDLTVLPSGAVTAPVSIGDKRFELIVDTGDIFSGISEDAVDAIGAKSRASATRFSFMGGVTVDRYAPVKDLRVGTLHAQTFNLVVLPRRLLDGTDGLLGPDILSGYDAEFDFARNKLNLFSAKHCPGNVVYWASAYGKVAMEMTDMHQMTVEVVLDGKPMKAFVDTGADKSTLSMAAAKAIFGIDPAKDPHLRRVMMPINGAAAQPVVQYPFATLALSDVTVTHPRIDIVEDAIWDRRMPPLLIGINVLRALHLYVAYDEGMLYVTPAEARDDQTRN